MAKPTDIVRKTFTYRKRNYVVIRFRDGRPELYRVEADGFTETFMGYAKRFRSIVESMAVRLVEDQLDPSACTAKNLLAGLIPGASNVRWQTDNNNRLKWGWVTADYVHPQTGVRRQVYASSRLSSPL